MIKSYATHSSPMSVTNQRPTVACAPCQMTSAIVYPIPLNSGTRQNPIIGPIIMYWIWKSEISSMRKSVKYRLKRLKNAPNFTTHRNFMGVRVWLNWIGFVHTIRRLKIFKLRSWLAFSGARHYSAGLRITLDASWPCAFVLAYPLFQCYSFVLSAGQWLSRFCVYSGIRIANFQFTVFLHINWILDRSVQT